MLQLVCSESNYPSKLNELLRVSSEGVRGGAVRGGDPVVAAVPGEPESQRRQLEPRGVHLVGQGRRLLAHLERGQNLRRQWLRPGQEDRYQVSFGKLGKKLVILYSQLLLHQTRLYRNSHIPDREFQSRRNSSACSFYLSNSQSIQWRVYAPVE